MKITHTLWRVFVRGCMATVVAAALATPVIAQIKAHTGEFSANFGFNNLTGIDNKKHPEFGFGFGYNFNRTFGLMGEFNYLPQGSTMSSGLAVSAHYLLFGPIARISLPVASRFVPFAVVGGGMSIATEYANDLPGASANASGVYATMGGGATYYVRPNWGFRAEYRWDDQRDSYKGETSTQSDSRELISIFYQSKPTDEQ